MTKWRNAIFMVALSAASLAATAQTTWPLSQGSGLTATVEGAADGDEITLSPGVYTTANTAAYNITGSFGIAKSVRIRGTGATPAAVVLRGGASPLGGYAVHFLRYSIPPTGTNPSGATLENVTIDTSPGGIRIDDFQNGGRLTDITLKNVVIQTTAVGGSFGVLLKNTDRIVIDNVTVSSYQAGFDLVNATDSLLMNSSVTSTVAGAAPGLAVLGGFGNTIVGNTFGTPKANPTVDSGYSFNAGGVVFYNTKANRFENNTVQGFRDDGLDFTSLNLPADLPAPQDTQQSTDNYVGKNNVISTGFAANLAGGSGIWSNCGSANTWLYANDSSGSVECGLCIWASNSNMALGNILRGHGSTGIFLSGGAETTPFCTVDGGAHDVKPVNTFLRSNAAYYNRAEQILVRSADSTDVSLNFASPRNGRTGPLQPAADPTNGQSAVTFQTDSRYATSTGFRIAANISSENKRGLWNDDNKNDTGLEFFVNRILASTLNRVTTPTTLNIDAGLQLGGNYWSQHTASGNPSTSTPFSGVSHDSLNNFGRVVDRYPYKSEDLGKGGGVQVFEPRAGMTAQGTRRTVRWYAPGCIYVDIALDGVTALASDVPNTGYAVVGIGSPSVGSHNIVVKCKDSAGTVKGQGTSPNFSVTSSALQLRAPGRDDVFNAGQQIFVGWKKTSAIASVNVKLSLDGGVTFPTTLATGSTTTFARVTLPNVPSSAKAVIRVESGVSGDTTDGVFALRGTTGAGFTNVASGRIFVMGGFERLEWASPQNSRLVTIKANGVAIATNLPDRGYFDWIPKNLGAIAVTLAIDFKETTGTAISTSTSLVGNARYATTITFGPASPLSPGNSQSITATANSGLTVALSSLTTGVCSVAGNTVTAIANGTCTIAGNQAGNATYAPAAQVTLSFTVSASTAIPRLSGISTRMGVLTGDNVLIGGFIIGGSTAKKVVINARGPSLTGQGVAGALANPTLTLVPSSGPATTNNDWQSAPNAAEIQSLGLAPPNALESSILATLNPGAYTAIVSGVGGGTGVGIVEVFEVDHPEIPMVGISTRGRVQTGDGVMIGGFIIQGSSAMSVVIRAKGPSLTAQGVAGALANPTLTLVPASGPATTNDDWGTAANASTLLASGLAPTDSRESAILITLNPGAYTAIVSGVGGTTGVALVEVYKQ